MDNGTAREVAYTLISEYGNEIPLKAMISGARQARVSVNTLAETINSVALDIR